MLDSNQVLRRRDIIALGFMTFALFVGAGNIIFPPLIGLQAGTRYGTAAIGFLLTGVGLPILTIVAMARVGGTLDKLSGPLGTVAARALAVVCYLAVGPLFATPRTATVSFALGIVPWTGNSASALFIYSVLYFVAVLLLSLYPGKLLDIVGRILAPVKIGMLTILAASAMFIAAGYPGVPTPEYATHALSSGFTNGYLTMDTLGAMVFGIVVVNAMRSRGVTSAYAQTRYAMIAGIIAGVGLALLYLGLFKLGAESRTLAPSATNGAQILDAYVAHAFGNGGVVLLTVLITVACLVTAVGLTCACAAYFSEWLQIGYRTMAIGLSLFALLVSNLGLDHLIAFSIPALTAIYPPCIILVVMSFTLHRTRTPSRVLWPVMFVTTVMGCLDGLHSANLTMPVLSHWARSLPFAQAGLGWLLPGLTVWALAWVYDGVAGHTRPVRDQV
ncbi:branched-chain amino acid transport system II carrier protein [Robbsia andropogonis]|uniref:branched-chain amino acid transport system II carrier protein n=1 Tax=Robbsia andropogonis TaxID=28092 RepID=UPI0020A052E2|nr:branched-chain amino acid transport system II carrier protein [Robbsia andropogonis]MCP1118002.1 branched-chain amino acid transport system II carrier protein [Robbsia andropogonis]MCP1127717.1 branched-chain amino acid transport system II carrier protein [Robbsia andropogonis]